MRASEPDFEIKVRGSTLRFYDALEKAIKRYRPENYIRYMAARMREVRSDIAKFRQTPPHRVLHSIEANCAFHKQGYDEKIDWPAVAKIMNTYYDYIDLLQTATIRDALQRFFLMMYREQMEVQKRGSWEYMARTWELFVENPQMQSVSDRLRRTIGLECKQWIQLCFLAWAAARLSTQSAFVKDAIMNFDGLPMEESAVDAFLRRSSRSPEEIGGRFRETRLQFAPKFHSLIRSVFLEYPIVRFENGNMVCPHDDLLLLHSGTGLYRLAKSIIGFDRAFSHGFERYVETLLGYFNKKCHLLTERELLASGRGKSCDFLLELPDVVVLIECKACMLTANLLTDAAIENDNSTGKVAKGIEQLSASARELAAGRFSSFGVDPAKEALGIVVTFGDIPSANSDWYFERFFLKRAEQRQHGNLLPSGMMTRRPIVISVDALEDFVRVSNTLGKSVLDIYIEKEKQPYLIVGDWDSYLQQLLADSHMIIADLPLIKENVNRLLATLGVPR